MTGLGKLMHQLHPSRLFVSAEEINRGHCDICDFTLHVSEAKDFKCSSKMMYFCDVELDNILFARTSMKQCASDCVFWGEHFKFSNLPCFKSATIKVYRAIGRREKVKAQFVGTVTLLIEDVAIGQEHEEWYPLESNNRSLSHVTVRIRTAYRTFTVLPLHIYSSLIDYLLSNCCTLCQTLEPLLTSKVKDELAQTLVNILGSNGKAIQFLFDVLMHEVSTVSHDSLILRANTFASKSIDHFMKRTAMSYLISTLQGTIQFAIESNADCEVDPSRIQPNADLSVNQANLLCLIKRAWEDIYSSSAAFPMELKRLFCKIREAISQRTEIWQRVVSGTLFLRFFCPAILSPNLFHLWRESPADGASRRLTLVAKVLQNMANFTRFGVKEDYLNFMNDYVDQEMSKMEDFLAMAASGDDGAEYAPNWNDSSIIPLLSCAPPKPSIGQPLFVERGPATPPLGRDFAIFHQILRGNLQKLKEDSLEKLGSLPNIVANVQQEVERTRISDPSPRTQNNLEAARLPVTEEPDENERMKIKSAVSPHFPTKLIHNGGLTCYKQSIFHRSGSTDDIFIHTSEHADDPDDSNYSQAISVTKRMSEHASLPVVVESTATEGNIDIEDTFSRLEEELRADLELCSSTQAQPKPLPAASELTVITNHSQEEQKHRKVQQHSRTSVQCKEDSHNESNCNLPLSLGEDKLLAENDVDNTTRVSLHISKT